MSKHPIVRRRSSHSDTPESGGGSVPTSPCPSIRSGSVRASTLLSLLFVAALLGCLDPLGLRSDDPVTLTLTTADEPLSGAHVVGGVDFTRFEVRSDDDGRVAIPATALGDSVLVIATNVVPRRILVRRDETYELPPTDRRLRYVGEAPGRPLRFGDGELLTLASLGGYRLYQYGPGVMTTLHRDSLEIGSIRQHRLYGDTLWVSTHREGIHAYLIEPDGRFTKIFHLDISGPIGSFVRRDSQLVVAHRTDLPGPLQVFRLLDGGADPIATFEEVHAFRMQRDGPNVVIGAEDRTGFAGGDDPMLRVLNLDDPVELTFSGLVRTGGISVLENSTYIITSIPHLWEGDSVPHEVFELGPAGEPESRGELVAPAAINGFVGDLAYGHHVRSPHTVTLLEVQEDRARTVATAVAPGRPFLPSVQHYERTFAATDGEGFYWLAGHLWFLEQPQ